MPDAKNWPKDAVEAYGAAQKRAREQMKRAKKAEAQLKTAEEHIFSGFNVFRKSEEYVSLKKEVTRLRGVLGTLMADPDPSVQDLKRELDATRAKLAIALDGLNNIACWGSGETVDGTFDEPGSAEMARETLEKVK